MRRLLAVVVVLALLGIGCVVVATPDGLAVGIDLTPRYSYIPGTSIRSVTNASGDVFYHNNTYWRHWNGSWWHSSIWNGGWIRTLAVPDAFLSIPATHPKYHIVRSHPRYGSRPSIVRPVKPGLGHLIKKTVPGSRAVKVVPGRGPAVRARPGSRTPVRVVPGKAPAVKVRPGSRTPVKVVPGKKTDKKTDKK